MQHIDVKLRGHFVQTYNEKAIKGQLAIIDKIKIGENCLTGVMMRVVNIWKRQAWLDSSWFKFEPIIKGGKK